MEKTFRQIDQEPQDVNKTHRLVGFMVGKELFGVEILTVQEIIRDTRITDIPDAPDFIEGVINLRGNIIPVIDLRKRLKLTGEEAVDAGGWVLILTVAGRVTGFVVDGVTKIVSIPADSIKPPPEIVMAGLKSQYIRGVCKMDHRLLILLDFERILMVDEILKLKGMKRAKTRAA